MKISDLKVSLAKRILDSNDEAQLRAVDSILSDSVSFQLSDEQKAELDRDFADYTAGVGSDHSWAEVKAHARRQKKGA